MPVHLQDNPYAGINAHLMSYLQTPQEEWAAFHNVHIVDIAKKIDSVLPCGYYAVSEASLQLRDDSEALVKRSYSVADVMIRNRSHPDFSTDVTPGAVVATMPLSETLNEEYYWNATVIYQKGEGSGGKGRPITRIELLSPANKQGGSHHE
jgi:hypothetical protein